MTTTRDHSPKIYCIGSFMNAAGAQEALVRVSKQLRKRGYNTQVRFFYLGKVAFQDESHVKVITPAPRLNAMGYIKAFYRLWCELKREKPQAVICFMPLGAVFGTLAGYMAGVPIRVASHRSPGPTFGRAMRLLDRILGNTAVYTSTICVSHSVLDSFANYSKRYRDKMSVVQNGIEWRKSVLDRRAVRARYGLPQDETLFLAIGRLSYQKNYAFLIDRVAETPGLHLVIAGDGELRPQIEEQIRRHNIGHRVHLLGVVPHNDVYDLLPAADVFVMPTLFEGMSNATLEAMHAGLPIVSSDIVMQREVLVKDDGTHVGLLVGLDDPAGWVGAFTLLHSSPEERERLGALALDHVETTFSLDAMTDGFERQVTRGTNSVTPSPRITSSAA